MVQIKTAAQISLMREAGIITGEALIIAGEAVRPGVTTKYLDDIIRRHIVELFLRFSDTAVSRQVLV